MYFVFYRFMRVKVTNEPGLDDTTADGMPLWPIVYYCLRCGDVAAAIQSLEQAGYRVLSNVIFDLQ